jgi:hypothetical protein
VADRLSLGATVMNGKAGYPESTAKPTVLDQQLSVIVDQALAQVNSHLLRRVDLCRVHTVIRVRARAASRLGTSSC